MMSLYVDGYFFLYISGRVTVPSEFLPFTPFVFFYSCTLITGPPLISVLITQDVKIIQFKYDDDYDDDADDVDDGDDDDDVDDDDDDYYYYYIITKYLMFKQIYGDQ